MNSQETEIEQLRVLLRSQASQLAGMREALRFYANSDEYHIAYSPKLSDATLRGTIYGDVIRDCGAKAYAAFSAPASDWEKRVHGLVEALKELDARYVHTCAHESCDKCITQSALAAWEGKS